MCVILGGVGWMDGKGGCWMCVFDSCGSGHDPCLWSSKSGWVGHVSEAL